MLLPVSDTDFSVFWQPLSEKILTNDLVLRIVKALPFIHQPDRVVRKVKTCQQLIGDIKHVKKIRYFFTCVVTAFHRARNPFITP